MKGTAADNLAVAWYIQHACTVYVTNFRLKRAFLWVQYRYSCAIQWRIWLLQNVLHPRVRGTETNQSIKVIKITNLCGFWLAYFINGCALAYQQIIPHAHHFWQTPHKQVESRRHFRKCPLHRKWPAPLCTTLSLSFQFLTCHHPLKGCVEGPYQCSTPLKSLRVGLTSGEPSR